MKPVFELTLDEALLEMERLADARPGQEDVCELLRWNREHGQRLAELEVWVMTHSPREAAAAIPEPQPEPLPEPVMPVPSPQEQLAIPLGRLASYTETAAAATTERAYRNALNQIYQHRSLVKQLAKKLHLDQPELPDIPANRWLKSDLEEVPTPEPAADRMKTKRAAAKAEGMCGGCFKRIAMPGDTRCGVCAESQEEYKAAQRGREAAPVTPAAPSAPVTLHIAQVRRSVWLLMAALEELPPKERAHLALDLAMLDAAAHAAHGLATGQLQVV